MVPNVGSNCLSGTPTEGLGGTLERKQSSIESLFLTSQYLLRVQSPLSGKKSAATRSVQGSVSAIGWWGWHSGAAAAGGLGGVVAVSRR